MANEIKTLLNSQTGLKNDWKQDWKEDVNVGPGWKVDWAVDTGQPVNTVLPVISDVTPQVGNALTVTTGTWTGDATITYTYEWLRDTTIVGTGNAYTVVAADLAGVLKVKVRAQNGKGTAFVETAGTTAVAAA